jgi:hypothetical protein
MATFLQIIQSVCREFGYASPSTVANQSDETVLRVMENVNTCYGELLMLLGDSNPLGQFETTVTLVANSDNVSIPTTLRRVDSVMDSDGRQLTVVPWKEFLEIKNQTLFLDPILDPINTVGYVSFFGTKIYFFGTTTANQTITIRGVRDLSNMTINSSVPLLPDECQNVLVDMAKARESTYIGKSPEIYIARAEKAIQLVKGKFNRHHGEALRMRRADDVRRANEIRWWVLSDA